MPVYLGLANVVFKKETLEKKYSGGCFQFWIDRHITNVEGNQGDYELINITSMNMNEISKQQAQRINLFTTIKTDSNEV